MSIGNNIRNARKNQKMTLQQIADKMGCSQQNISQYETGKRKPKLETLQKLSKALDVPLDNLLELGNNHTSEELMEIIEIYNEQQKELNKDNAIRHHLLIHHYDEMGRIGRDSLFEILAHLKLLNEDGQTEASKRVEELTEIPRYTKPDEPPQNNP